MKRSPRLPPWLAASRLNGNESYHLRKNLTHLASLGVPKPSLFPFCSGLETHVHVRSAQHAKKEPQKSCFRCQVANTYFRKYVLQAPRIRINLVAREYRNEHNAMVMHRTRLDLAAHPFVSLALLAQS